VSKSPSGEPYEIACLVRDWPKIELALKFEAKSPF
jgi:hypothetical protein